MHKLWNLRKAHTRLETYLYCFLDLTSLDVVKIRSQGNTVMIFFRNVYFEMNFILFHYSQEEPLASGRVQAGSSAVHRRLRQRKRRRHSRGAERRCFASVNGAPLANTHSTTTTQKSSADLWGAPTEPQQFGFERFTAMAMKMKFDNVQSNGKITMIRIANTEKMSVFLVHEIHMLIEMKEMVTL